jgi:hypothetical protein
LLTDEKESSKEDLMCPLYSAKSVFRDYHFSPSGRKGEKQTCLERADKGRIFAVTFPVAFKIH